MSTQTGDRTIVYDFAVRQSHVGDQSPPTHGYSPHIATQWPVYTLGNQVFRKIMYTKLMVDCCAFNTYWWHASSQYSMRHTHFYARTVCSKLHLQPVPGYQCMERNLIVITFPADFISWVEHDLSEAGVCYLFRCVDYVGAWCRPSSRPRPSSPHPLCHMATIHHTHAGARK